MNAWNALSLLVAVVILGLMVFELQTWARDRKAAGNRRAAMWRLARRAAGTAILLTVLALLNFPDPTTLAPRLFLEKIAISALLCVALFALMVWDSRIVIRSVARQSAQDLREWLHAIPSAGEVSSATSCAKKDPELPHEPSR